MLDFRLIMRTDTAWVAANCDRQNNNRTTYNAYKLYSYYYVKLI